MGRAHARAGSDKKPLFEDVLLRIDAGTDEDTVQFGTLALRIHAAAVGNEALEGKTWLRVKVTFEGIQEGDADGVVTFAKATLVTLKEKTSLLVKGPKGEPFSRTINPKAPKFFEYGVLLPPKAAGTRYVVVFEMEAEVDKKPVRKLLRTPVGAVEKKPSD